MYGFPQMFRSLSRENPKYSLWLGDEPPAFADLACLSIWVIDFRFQSIYRDRALHHQIENYEKANFNHDGSVGNGFRSPI